jgi:hypothetical protein
VRRDDGASPLREESLEPCDRESAAFLRVGGASDLVHERERARPRFRENPGQDLHRGGERRAVRQDRLRVSDLGADRIEERQSGAGRGRDRESRLGEQREEPGRLEHDRLSSGVGPRHDEEPAVLRKLEVERHDRALGSRLAEDPPAQRRKTRVEQGWRAPVSVHEPSSEISGIRPR